MPPPARSTTDEATGRAFIESTQERFYVRLAIARGWNPDPLEAHARHTALGAPKAISTDELKTALRGESISNADWQAFDDAVSKGFARYAEIPVQTAYEDPVFYPMISTIFERIYQDLDDKGFGVAHRPFIATLPSGHVNALSWPVPDTPLRAIFFEQGLFRYFHHIAIATAWAVPALPLTAFKDDGALLDIPTRHQIPGQASAIFTEVLASYGLNGAPPPGSGAVPNPEHNLVLAVAVLNYMEEFVLAHELAHIMNRDAERLERGDVSSLDAEHQADRLAAHVVTSRAYRDTGAFAIAFAGCDLALTALHFLDLALATLNHGAQSFTWISKTHPDAISRRDFVRECLDDMLPNDAPAARDAAQTLSNITDVTLARMWRIAEPALLIAFEQGQRPSPIWRDHLRTSLEVATSPRLH